MGWARRYAVYYTPEPASALGRLGRSWLGRNPSAVDRDAGRCLEKISWEDWHRVIARPRRYGFHATLKAPFWIRSGVSERKLVSTLGALTSSNDTVPVGRLELRRMGDFLALVPVRPPAALADLAMACVETFEPFRDEMPRDELTRRIEGLTARQRRYLRSHGYAYVFEEFRFHMTLTGPVDDALAQALFPVLERLCAPACAEPLEIDALSLMLEAMEERQVTVAGTTHEMPPLFMVMATQNPVEQEGTYPLPEAQMDRFLMHVNIGYTPVEDEVRIIELVREEENASTAENSAESRPTDTGRIPQSAIFAARAEIGQVHVSEAIARYIADIVYATRTPDRYSEDLARWIDVGASPRGSLALDRCSRAHAWLNGREYVDPGDVRAIVHDCLRHRLMLSYEAQGEGVSADRVIDTVVGQIALP